VSAKGTDLTRGARRLSVLTMLSRLLGLVREQIFALSLGASGSSDAFLAAFRIPNMLRDLFAEGALSTAFVPTYVKVLGTQGREQAWALANRVLTTLTIYLGSVAVLAMLFPQPVVDVVANGFSAEKAVLTAKLLRIMMPFLPTISLAVVAMGALNAEEKYTAPGLASSVFNVVAIVGGLATHLITHDPVVAVFAWAGLTVAGGVGQLLVQLPSLWKLGFRPRILPDLRLRDAGTRRIAAMMAPATLGVAAVQINVVVSTSFASRGVEGSISWLSYAFRLMQLPIGVFGVAIGTAALTHLSRDAATADLGALRATLRRALQLVLFLTLPATVGLVVLGVPIIRLIFEHGRFSSFATLQTARALSGYAVGLVAYASVKVLAPAFYALGRPRIPLIASLSAVAANIVWNLVTFHRFGHVGLALGTSLAALMNVGVLLAAFQKRVGGLFDRSFASASLRIVLASGVMGGLVFGLSWLFESRPSHALVFRHSLVFRFAAALLPVTLGGGAYLLVGKWLGLDEGKTLLRRRRRAAAPAQPTVP